MSPAIEMTNDDVISISFDNVKISFFFLKNRQQKQANITLNMK